MAKGKKKRFFLSQSSKIVSNSIASTSNPLPKKFIIYFETNIETSFGMSVTYDETVGDIKKRILEHHLSNFPDFGEIEVLHIKFDKDGICFLLTDCTTIGTFVEEQSKGSILHVDINVNVCSAVKGSQSHDAIKKKMRRTKKKKRLNDAKEKTESLSSMDYQGNIETESEENKQNSCATLSSESDFEIIDIKHTIKDYGCKIIDNGTKHKKYDFTEFHERHENGSLPINKDTIRRTLPLSLLSSNDENWVIKVRVTKVGELRPFNNATRKGLVFDVILTDCEDCKQIRAVMFNEVAKKFHGMLKLGVVYYISGGMIKTANKKFITVENDYELTLDNNTEVGELITEAVIVPETRYNSVKIDKLGGYVNSEKLVDVIGIILSSSTMSVRRKRDNKLLTKLEISVGDDSGKTVRVSLWEELGRNVIQELSSVAQSATVVIAISCLNVGGYEGVSLSTGSTSTVQINPDLPETKSLLSWYDSIGKWTEFVSAGSILTSTSKGGCRRF